MINKSFYQIKDEWSNMSTLCRLKLWCYFRYGISDLDSKFINIISPTDNEKVLFCLEHGEDAYECVVKYIKTEEDIRIYELKEGDIKNKRNKHVNKQKMNPYYQKEEWKK